jgi:hypothetical protein
MRDEIPCIDTQLSRDVCLDPDAVLAALAKSKVACARLCRDKAEVEPLSIFSCRASVDIQLSKSLSGHLHARRESQPRAVRLISTSPRLGDPCA